MSAAAPAARTAAQQRSVLTALRAQMQQASQVVQTTQQQAGAAATQIRSLQYPKDSPASSGDGVQALDDGKKPPPHGHDPRYWVDVTKIIEVPDGELAPHGYVQIGPNQWYPFEDNQYSVHPPPDPVKYPLDMHDITKTSSHRGDRRSSRSTSATSFASRMGRKRPGGSRSIFPDGLPPTLPQVATVVRPRITSLHDRLGRSGTVCAFGGYLPGSRANLWRGERQAWFNV
jgi:hypothetical protein